MNRWLIFSLALCACSHMGTLPEEPAPEPAEVALSDEAFNERVFDGAAGTTWSLERIAATVDALDDEALGDVRMASALLQVNCPYNRSAYQIPMALSRTADRIPAENLEPMVRREWRRIQAGLRLHASIVTKLSGPELADPRPGDHLADFPEVLQDSLLGVGDPLAASLALVDATPAIVEAYSTDTKATIDVAHEVLMVNTGREWPMKRELLAWKRALMSVNVHVRNPDAAREIDAMIQLIETFARGRC